MPVLYTVQYGDTLLAISEYFGIPLTNLTQINNIYYPYTIHTGQKLIIPAGNFNYASPYYADQGTPRTYGNESPRQDPSHVDSETIERTIGKMGTKQDSVLKFTFPRYDLKISIGAVSLEPEFALTSWMAFQPAKNDTMVMGDIVLLENEINPVVSQLMANGLEITALHNHLLGELPRVMYLHISGIGEAARLAQGIRNALSVTNTPFAAHTVSQTLPQNYWNTVEEIMGKKGNRVGRLLQFSYPRADVIKEHDIIIPPSMGISQAINFQAEGQNAAITGDLVLTANEVNPVIRTLRENGITVTAIHNHMLYDSPRLFFLHFWAVDNPEKLAYGLRQALGQTNTIMR